MNTFNQVNEVVPMSERPIIKSMFKPKQAQNDKVRKKIYSRTIENKQFTKKLNSFAGLASCN